MGTNLFSKRKYDLNINDNICPSLTWKDINHSNILHKSSKVSKPEIDE
jgi:hypothetical protein